MLAGNSGPRPLDGTMVLDLTRLLPGAFCTQILADMGAEVVKIEDPRGGDYNRSWPPLARTESGSFLLLNRNKKSVTINLKSAEGKELFRRMAAGADVIVEGYRPGVMDRLGLSYQSLRRDNPGLVYCAISGFGQDGPARLQSGHDLNYMAITGALQLFGKAGERPIVPGLSIADVGGGSLMAATGILAALLARARSGEGQFVDISMTDGVMAWLALHGAEYLFGGIEPRGGERPFIGQAPCYNIYTCGCGAHVALGAIEPHFWERFCDMIELPDALRVHWPRGEEADRVFAAVEARLSVRPRKDWLERAQRLDVPLSPVNGMKEAFEEPQIVHREMLTSIDHPVEGRIPQFGFPIKLSGTPCRIDSPPPTLGEHTEEIMRGYGYAPAEIARLKSEGCV